MRKYALLIILFFALFLSGCVSKKPGVENKKELVEQASGFFLDLSSDIKNGKWENVWNRLSEESKISFINEMNALRKDLYEVPPEERKANIPGFTVSYEHVLQLTDMALFDFIMSNKKANIGVLSELHSDFEQIPSGILNKASVTSSSAELVLRNGNIRKLVYSKGKWYLDFLLTKD